jgi:hypothetical protein
VNSAPLHPCELSSGDLISVDGSNYTVKQVLKNQLKIEVARTDNEDIKLVLDFHELFLNPTFSTNSGRDAGWGEGDMTVGNSTILNMSILEFTRICLMSGLDINPQRIEFVGKSPTTCLECLNTQYITAKGCSKEKNLTALLTSKLQNQSAERDKNLVTNFKKLFYRVLPVWLHVANTLASPMQEAQTSPTRLVDTAAREQASITLSRLVDDVQTAGGEVIALVGFQDQPTVSFFPRNFTLA